MRREGSAEGTLEDSTSRLGLGLQGCSHCSCCVFRPHGTEHGPMPSIIAPTDLLHCGAFQGSKSLHSTGVGTRTPIQLLDALSMVAVSIKSSEESCCEVHSILGSQKLPLLGFHIFSLFRSPYQSTLGSALSFIILISPCCRVPEILWTQRS